MSEDQRLAIVAAVVGIIGPVLTIVFTKGGPVLLRYLRQTSDDERREQEVRDSLIRDGGAQLIAQLQKEIAKLESRLDKVNTALEQSRTEHMKCLVEQAALREQNKSQQCDISELQEQVRELKTRTA